jgi:hypothetical protein
MSPGVHDRAGVLGELVEAGDFGSAKRKSRIPAL